MSVQLDRVGWENGTLVSPAKVNIQGTVYDVTPEVYSGNTPLTAENLKEMENNTEDGINASIIESNTYSTTETVVGKWIDNKPIYRKVIDLGVMSADSNNFIMNTTENFFDTVTQFHGYIYNPTEGKKASLTYRTYDTSQPWRAISWTINSQNRLSIQVVRLNNVVWNDWKIILVVEYTKTTD